MKSYLSYLILIFALVAAEDSFAQYNSLIDTGTNTRALGMGNAYTAIVNDKDSLFYNPAGLARSEGIYWTILDIKAEASGIDTMTTLSDAQGGGGFADTMRALYGENAWLGFGGQTTYTMPYFAASLYNNAYLSLFVDNPVSPEVIVNYANDLGIALGFAVPILPMLHIGATFKRITRTGASQAFGPDELVDLDPAVITNGVDQQGVGWSADLGVNLVFPGAPMNPTVSFVYKDVGSTKFVTTAGGTPPQSQDQEMTVGFGLATDLTFATLISAMDVRWINRGDVQMGKRVNIGFEMGLPLVDIRAGFQQGYISYGVGMDLGLFRIDAASYGLELGEYPGQLEDRRYAIEFIMELGFDTGYGIFGEESGDGSKGSNSRSRRRNSSLKQRR